MQNDFARAEIQFSSQAAAKSASRRALELNHLTNQVTVIGGNQQRRAILVGTVHTDEKTAVNSEPTPQMVRADSVSVGSKDVIGIVFISTNVIYTLEELMYIADRTVLGSNFTLYNYDGSLFTDRAFGEENEKLIVKYESIE